MDTENFIKLTDDIVFAKTGKHLDDLQQTVLTGTLQGQRYWKIAHDLHCSPGYIRDIGSKLWQILSESLGENVTKSNVKVTLERNAVSNISNYGNFVQQFGHVNQFCPEDKQSLKAKQQASPQSTVNPNYSDGKQHIDLRDAPNLTAFFNRTEELKTLQKWILKEQCRLVMILGMSGIGKSAVARQLTQQIQMEFDCIIWRSLRTSPPLNSLLKDLVNSLNSIETDHSETLDSRLELLMNYLRHRHCLIILDDVQCLFNSGQLAGYYKPGYDNYGTLFQLIAEVTHPSCLLLNSWEPPLELLKFNKQDSSVQSLKLPGLTTGGIELFKQIGLKDEDNWLELINLYQGNPLFLQLISQIIQQLFSGGVAEYLKYESVFLEDEIFNILTTQFNRLTHLEKQAIAILCSESSPLSIPDLSCKLTCSTSDLFKVILSLQRRGWIERKQDIDLSEFQVNLLIKKYLEVLNLG